MLELCPGRAGGGSLGVVGCIGGRFVCGAEGRLGLCGDCGSKIESDEEEEGEETEGR